MWKTVNRHGEELIWYSKDEVNKKFIKIQNVLYGTLFQTKEANQLKDVILRIINEVQDG